MDTFLGSILLVPYNFTPAGWLDCNGGLLSIKDHAALYSLLGNMYGGDYRTTFALPKLEAPVEGMRYIICINGMYPNRP